MILFSAKRYNGNPSSEEVYYFLDENKLYSFLNSQKDYHGYAVDPIKNKMYWNPINWNLEKVGNDDSIDYIEDYLQFKSNLKCDYQPISVSLFLKIYPRMLLQKEILKLSNLN